MSRIGNKHIDLPEGVEVLVNGHEVTVKGPKGTLTKSFNNLVEIEVKDNQVFVRRVNETKPAKQMHGTTRSIINGMVKGVHEEFKKILLITGTGYRAQMEGKNLVLNLGYSHPITIPSVEGIKIEVVSPTEVHVSDVIKKQLVKLLLKFVQKEDLNLIKVKEFAIAMKLLDVRKAKKLANSH